MTAVPSSFALALVYVVPIGMIQAVTNRQVGLKWVVLTVLGNLDVRLKGVRFSVVTELIIGYMIPGLSPSLKLAVFTELSQENLMQ